MDIFERLRAMLDGQLVPKSQLDSASAAAAASAAELAALRVSAETANEEARASAKRADLAESSLASVRSEFSGLQSALASAISDRDALRARLDDPAGEIAQRVSQALAAQSLPANKLPKTDGASAEASLDAVRAALASEPDPLKRATLALKARELRGHSDCFADK